MAKVRSTASVGAAVFFIAGLSLVVPAATAVATADTDTSSASASDSASNASEAKPSRGRAGKPTLRGGTIRTQSPPAAASEEPTRRGTRAGDLASLDSVGAVEVSPSSRNPAASSPVGSSATESAPESAAQAAQAATESTTRAAEPASPTAPAAATAATASAAAAAEPAPAITESAAVPDVEALETIVAAEPVIAPVASQSSDSVVSLTASAGASARMSTAALIEKLLAPIKSIFGEGTALLLRRSLFNQAPVVTPVQLTGQVTGPITGSLGAVDLEGDQMTYTITSNGHFGTATVHADGTYTYTPGADFTGTDSFVVSVADVGRRLNILDLSRPGSTSAGVAVSQGALAALLQFQFVYGAGSQYWTSAARGALESAASLLSSYIVVTSPVTVTYAVTGKSSPFSATLASAGSDFVNNASGFLPTVVQAKIQTGFDANGSAPDGNIDWNFGSSWAFGNSVPSTQYDFQSIAMHELLHTMGFLSNISQAGSNTGAVWTVFDGYVMNSAGTRVIDSNTAKWNSVYNTNLTGGSGGLYFGGPNAIAAYSALVPLYTPNPWESGSSLSHLNDNAFTGSKDKLMNAFSGQGPGIRVLSPIELGILTDIGYTITNGPGASTLLFVGIFALRRRRREN